MAVSSTARSPSWLLIAAALPFLFMFVLKPVRSAPTESENSNALEVYDESGCYYNYQHYGEGDRIITNEPCLNCTCHNRMLMCYLKVCPFTKAIGQDCTVEKRPDQCCPVITCPEVPVQLLDNNPSPSTTLRPVASHSTALGHPDSYGCSIDSEFYADGAQVPSDRNKPCELCYCIRNHTACVMQECTLNVEGCKPVYQEGVCCPVRYECEYPDETTTLGTIAGFFFTTTTTMAPNTICKHNGEEYADGALIQMDDKPCEHCYCMRGEIVCAVQECGTPLEREGHNCTAMPIQHGKCCPEMYQCDSMLPALSDASTQQSDDVPQLPQHDDQISGVALNADEAEKPADTAHTDAPDQVSYTESKPAMESDSFVHDEHEDQQEVTTLPPSDIEQAADDHIPSEVHDEQKPSYGDKPADHEVEIEPVHQDAVHDEFDDLSEIHHEEHESVKPAQEEHSDEAEKEPEAEFASPTDAPIVQDHVEENKEQDHKEPDQHVQEDHTEAAVEEEIQHVTEHVESEKDQPAEIQHEPVEEVAQEFSTEASLQNDFPPSTDTPAEIVHDSVEAQYTPETAEDENVTEKEVVQNEPVQEVVDSAEPITKPEEPAQEEHEIHHEPAEEIVTEEPVQHEIEGSEKPAHPEEGIQHEPIDQEEILHEPVENGEIEHEPVQPEVSEPKPAEHEADEQEKPVESEVSDKTEEPSFEVVTGPTSADAEINHDQSEVHHEPSEVAQDVPEINTEQTKQPSAQEENVLSDFVETDDKTEEPVKETEPVNTEAPLQEPVADDHASEHKPEQVDDHSEVHQDEVQTNDEVVNEEAPATTVASVADEVGSEKETDENAVQMDNIPVEDIPEAVEEKHPEPNQDDSADNAVASEVSTEEPKPSIENQDIPQSAVVEEHKPEVENFETAPQHEIPASDEQETHETEENEKHPEHEITNDTAEVQTEPEIEADVTEKPENSQPIPQQPADDHVEEHIEVATDVPEKTDEEPVHDVHVDEPVQDVHENKPVQDVPVDEPVETHEDNFSIIETMTKPTMESDSMVHEAAAPLNEVESEKHEEKHTTEKAPEAISLGDIIEEVSKLPSVISLTPQHPFLQDMEEAEHHYETDDDHVESQSDSKEPETEIEDVKETVPIHSDSAQSSEEVTEAGDEISTESSVEFIKDQIIPGEGDCRVENTVFKSGEKVPVSNNCQKECECKNSIVHCQLQECPPPPSNDRDCMPVVHEGKCCPSYTCENAPQYEIVTDHPAGVALDGSQEDGENHAEEFVTEGFVPQTDAPAQATPDSKPADFIQDEIEHITEEIPKPVNGEPTSHPGQGSHPAQVPLLFDGVALDSGDEDEKPVAHEDSPAQEPTYDHIDQHHEEDHEIEIVTAPSITEGPDAVEANKPAQPEETPEVHADHVQNVSEDEEAQDFATNAPIAEVSDVSSTQTPLVENAPDVQTDVSSTQTPEVENAPDVQTEGLQYDVQTDVPFKPIITHDEPQQPEVPVHHDEEQQPQQETAHPEHVEEVAPATEAPEEEKEAEVTVAPIPAEIVKPESDAVPQEVESHEPEHVAEQHVTFKPEAIPEQSTEEAEKVPEPEKEKPADENDEVPEWVKPPTPVGVGFDAEAQYEVPEHHADEEVSTEIPFVSDPIPDFVSEIKPVKPVESADQVKPEEKPEKPSEIAQEPVEEHPSEIAHEPVEQHPSEISHKPTEEQPLEVEQKPVVPDSEIAHEPIEEHPSEVEYEPAQEHPSEVHQEPIEVVKEPEQTPGEPIENAQEPVTTEQPAEISQDTVDEQPNQPAEKPADFVHEPVESQPSEEPITSVSVEDKPEQPSHEPEPAEEKPEHSTEIAHEPVEEVAPVHEPVEEAAPVHEHAEVTPDHHSEEPAEIQHEPIEQQQPEVAPEENLTTFAPEVQQETAEDDKGQEPAITHEEHKPVDHIPETIPEVQQEPEEHHEVNVELVPEKPVEEHVPEVHQEPPVEHKPEGAVEEHKPSDAVEEHKPEEVVEDHKPEQAAEEHKPSDAVEEHKPEEVVEEHKPSDAVEEHKPEEITEQHKPVEVEEQVPEVHHEQPEQKPVEQEPELHHEQTEEPAEIHEEPKPAVPEEPKPVVHEEETEQGVIDEMYKPEHGLSQFPDMPGLPYEPVDEMFGFPEMAAMAGFDDEQGSFGPGTCRYGGKVYLSAQQIPRDDPCDFCFCFRSDIICLQQSCPPPIKDCHEEAIDGFCCPRYECPVQMAMRKNSTTTTTTTTAAPHLSQYIYEKQNNAGCLVQGELYKIGDEITSASGPCLECRCGGDSKMRCEPKECSPQPLIRKMIEAVSLRR
ncbi:titin isoform X2 [Neocloeon triangulifer]|uniref:titin isoform X2 n=1 Tax=Neocloeon triangulifer TaxID=2078957 RepID=UPI00286EBA04|nr:titin isoform X2 [Neocloeon triangulifer]